MKTVIRTLALRLHGERGVAAVEEGLMVTLIAMAIFGTVYLLGPNMNAAFDEGADN